MGIHGLSDILHKKYPQLFKPVHLSHFSFKKIAIDISLYIFRFKNAYPKRPENDPKYEESKYYWLSAFLSLVSCLRQNHVHCIFIYDSGNCVPEKLQERKIRADNKEKLNQRIVNLEMAIEKFHNEGEANEILFEFQKKRKLPVPLIGKRPLNIKAIELAVRKMNSQMIDILPEDIEITKELFKILDVPFFVAPLEAETMCSDLCIQEKVDAVLSADTDVLAYGAPIFLTDINTKNSTCVQVDYEEVLSELEISSDTFLDFCIMCGCDYNKNIPKIGPVTAFKMLKEKERIEDLEIDEEKLKILNYPRIRQLFRDYEKTNLKVVYCGFPDFIKLEKFKEKYKLRNDLEVLRKSFCDAEIVYE